MSTRMKAGDETVRAFWNLFVNRLAYTVQSPRPHKETGRHYYFRPKRGEQAVPLSLDTVRKHLEGQVTIGLYAINPRTQRCRWVAIDADYPHALEDLLKLQWELREDGVEAALEKSRRGGHLWILAESPLPARDCRLYIYNLASRLKVPIKGAGLADGLEIFPKQDRVGIGEFGNALRAPIGVHQAAHRRFWFFGADYNLEAQIGYLSRLKKMTESELAGFVKGLTMPGEFMPKPQETFSQKFPLRGALHEFRILDHVTIRRKMAKNYWTRCPSCAGQGRDNSGDNLAISTVDPRKYRCWAGCSREQIRAALGCPVRRRMA
jgi:hypothetical protein